ncbi:MAG: NAD(P)H-dependent oxidoreductase [Nitrospinota bacterium]
MPKILIIQGSLNPQSKTAIVVQEAEKILQGIEDIDFQTLDLRSLDMQFCDGRKLKEYNSDTQKAYKQVEEADGYIVGMPVYCYSVSGPLKNFIDITSSAMEEKSAGILCTTGSSMSYLASADLAKILAYESDVLSIQPVVCTSYEDFKEGKLVSKKAQEKLQAMIDVLVSQIKK